MQIANCHFMRPNCTLHIACAISKLNPKQYANFQMQIRNCNKSNCILHFHICTLKFFASFEIAKVQILHVQECCTFNLRFQLKKLFSKFSLKILLSKETTPSKSCFKKKEMQNQDAKMWSARNESETQFCCVLKSCNLHAQLQNQIHI